MKNHMLNFRYICMSELVVQNHVLILKIWLFYCIASFKFPWLVHGIWDWLLDLSCIMCWNLLNVLANIAVSIFRMKDVNQRGWLLCLQTVAPTASDDWILCRDKIWCWSHSQHPQVISPYHQRSNQNKEYEENMNQEDIYIVLSLHSDEHTNCGLLGWYGRIFTASILGWRWRQQGLPCHYMIP
jgi:hypothetical protein